MITYFGGDESDVQGARSEEADETAWEQASGSPFAMLRADEALWGGAKMVEAVRLAEIAVGEVAEKSAAAVAGGAVGSGSEAEGQAAVGATSDNVVKMDPEVGKALLEWSDRLRAAGRPMAACLALQAIALGIFNAHRQNCLHARRDPDRPLPSQSYPYPTPHPPSNPQDNDGVDAHGGFLDEIGSNGAGVPVSTKRRPFPGGYAECERYGSFDRLRTEFTEATGGAVVLSEWWTQGLTKNREYNLLAFLEGIPWLTRDDTLAGGGGLYIWIPPVEVAKALDAAVGGDEHGLGRGLRFRSPTAWLSGVGVGGAGKCVEEMEDRERFRLQDPCLQQFMSLLAYRDDVDFATAIHRWGYTNSAWLVLGRIAASAAALREEARDHNVAAVAARGRPSAASPRSRKAVENGERSDPGMDATPVSVDRERAEVLDIAASLAGIAVVTREVGVAEAVGVVGNGGDGLKSNDLLDVTPGLKRYGKPLAKRIIHHRSESGQRMGERGRVIMADGGVGDDEAANGSISTDGHKRQPGGSGDVDGEFVESDVAHVNGFTDTQRTPIVRAGGNGHAGAMLAAMMLAHDRKTHSGKKQQDFFCLSGWELDSRPEAFSPRLEAARFLMDLHCGAPIPAALVVSATNEWGGHGNEDDADGEVKGRGVIDRGACLDLIVVAAIKVSQDGGRMQLDSAELREGLEELLGVGISDWDTMVAATAVPGVRRRREDGLFTWDFQADAVQRAFVEERGIAGEGQEECGCAEHNFRRFRGFVTR